MNKDITKPILNSVNKLVNSILKLTIAAFLIYLMAGGSIIFKTDGPQTINHRVSTFLGDPIDIHLSGYVN